MKRAAADKWEAHKQRMVARHGRENDKEANIEANPTPSVNGGVWVDDNARGGPKCRRRCLARRSANPPQVLMALFGLTAVFGSTTGGKPQGKTGQGVSAADFLPATTAGGNFQGKTG